MRFRKSLIIFFVLISLFFNHKTNAQETEALWEIAFVKTRPGHYEDYFNYLKANWVKARKEARKQGFILSYKLLRLPNDSETDWDMLLITEYKNMNQYEAREKNFQIVFKKIRGDKGPTLIKGLGARDLADIKFSKLFYGSNLFSDRDR